MSDFNQAIIDEFRANNGKVGGYFAGANMLLLHTVGAKSGQARTNPVVYVTDGDRLVVIASNWGQRQHPAWYHNLCAHREATLTVGGVSRRVQAHEAVGEERVRLWQQDLEVYPGRTAYARRAAYRPIPVVVLAPVPDQPG